MIASPPVNVAVLHVMIAVSSVIIAVPPIVRRLSLPLVATSLLPAHASMSASHISSSLVPDAIAHCRLLPPADPYAGPSSTLRHTATAAARTSLPQLAAASRVYLQCVYAIPVSISPATTSSITSAVSPPLSGRRYRCRCSTSRCRLSVLSVLYVTLSTAITVATALRYHRMLLSLLL